MKRASFLLLAVLLILTLSIPGSALAQSGTPTWNSTIYYYNPQANAGSMGVTFVNSGTGTTPGEIPGIQLPGHAFGQVSVGSTGDYTGAATISADVPLVAVYKQYDAAGGTYAPLLYSSFDAAQSSTTGIFYVPSLLHTSSYVSRVGIQNIETEAVNLTLDFFGANGSKTVTLSRELASQGSLIFQIIDDADNVPGIGASFDGSLVISAVTAKGGSSARVVAAVEDLQSQGQRSYAYEGSGAPAKVFYLPYANCRYAANQQSTTFYVQNAGKKPATINVYYYTTSGAGITDYTPTTKVMPGARMAVTACATSKMNGKNGTARIASDQPLAVIGKTTGTDGLATAFTGQRAGGTRILLPYIPYSKLSSGERATLSIMNIGGQSATNVSINYYYKVSDTSFSAQKVVIASLAAPLARYGKYSAIPKVSGAALTFPGNGNYLGAAEVISDQPVVVVVRVSQAVTGNPGIITLGEDYTGIPCGNGCQ
jgi:hypothetical protein